MKRHDVYTVMSYCDRRRIPLPPREIIRSMRRRLFRLTRDLDHLVCLKTASQSGSKQFIGRKELCPPFIDKHVSVIIRHITKETNGYRQY